MWAEVNIIVAGRVYLRWLYEQNLTQVPGDELIRSSDLPKLPRTEAAVKEILSLPIYGELSLEDVDHVLIRPADPRERRRLIPPQGRLVELGKSENAPQQRDAEHRQRQRNGALRRHAVDAQQPGIRALSHADTRDGDRQQ